MTPGAAAGAAQPPERKECKRLEDPSAKSPDLSSLRRGVIVTAAATAVLVLAVAVFVALKLRGQTLRKADRELAAISRITAERTSQTLAAADILSLSVRDLALKELQPGQPTFSEDARAPEFHDALVRLQQLLPQVDVAAIIDNNGNPVASSRKYPAPPHNPALAEMFGGLKDRSDTGSVVMGPIWSPVARKWMVYLARPFKDPQGEFAGLVTVGISIEYFESYFASIDVGPMQAVSLIGNDGRLIARWPRVEPAIGKTMPGWEPGISLDPNQTAFGTAAGADGLVRMVADTRFDVARTPFYLGITQTKSAILQPWRNALSWIVLFAVVSLIVLAALVMFMLRAIVQEERWGRTLIERESRLSAQATELEIARNAAVQANRLRADFLSNMSHELRTPLNAVLGFSEILDKELFGPIGDEHYKEFVRDITTSARHLLGLIGNILDLTKTDEGKFAPDDEAIDMIDLMRLLGDLIAEAACAAGVELAVDVPSGPATVRGDKARLKQVLFNLLSSAVKSTPPGGRVVFSGETTSDGFAVRISDTGEQTAHRIANPDLGLPLANALVRLYDGRLTIDRGPVRGTTVTVWLSRGLIPRENDRHGAGSEVAAPSEAF